MAEEKKLADKLERKELPRKELPRFSLREMVAEARARATEKAEQAKKAAGEVGSSVYKNRKKLEGMRKMAESFKAGAEALVQEASQQQMPQVTETGEEKPQQQLKRTWEEKPRKSRWAELAEWVHSDAGKKAFQEAGKRSEDAKDIWDVK